MQINTRFNVGETVYLIQAKDVIKGMIVNIEILIEDKNGTKNNYIKYYISNYGVMNEIFLYKTKEEALKEMFQYIHELNADVI